ncbi:MAG: peptide chain release factor 1 [Clostridiales bacterium]|nr:peptide chain release factor 1 [Clostridiales bacterium]
MEQILHRYDEIIASMADPAIVSDGARYLKLTKELADLEPVVTRIHDKDRVVRELSDARELHTSADDEEMRQMAAEEVSALEKELETIEADLEDLLAVKDPKDDRSVIMEIRAGAGGEEAALFVADLYKMYTAYALSKGWKIEYIDSNDTELGGYQKLVYSIEGKGAYSCFKYESGVHRVQRVPVTESGGRVHTSTVTVAVLPEVDEVEVNINPNDLKIDTFRASGAGGQHINRTDSAIRITHIPTGLVVTCQDERSQHKNRAKAMAVLQSRLLEMEESKQSGAIAAERRSQVGTGDRSEKIRTYNYHQGRVTDHRIGLTLYRLEEILGGDLEEIVRQLTLADRANKLGSGSGDEGDDE